jgi:hypothetical protein
MGRVIARVSGTRRPNDVLIDVYALTFLIITMSLGYLPIPPREEAIYIGASILLGAIAGALLIMMLRRIVTATFTEDGLIIERGGERGRVFIPRDVVVAGNVVCIERDSRGRSYRMRVAYGGRVYTISLMNKRLVDKMVDRLRRNWGWTPPECPST